METHRIPLESTRKEQEEAEKEAEKFRRQLEELEEKDRLARAAALYEAERRRNQTHSFSDKEWERMKVRSKMANRSRRRNRK